MEYVTCCVNSKAKDIGAMVDRAREITYRTFVRHVGARQVAKQFGYEIDRRKGLTLKEDYAVSFHRSRFRGKPCVYMRHSAIEYIYQ